MISFSEKVNFRILRGLWWGTTLIAATVGWLLLASDDLFCS